ncbi:hypothetical protein MNBD_GAMMA09-3706 [hydrothermal vent metagenome]|uniref:Tat (Twin-arginine translocation) pathway signal sequence domain protein n=1 Tax=hydrothermal vent metagenome TaxID=652676 RepID=A0A3B0Y113_9ZZZZ
MKNESELISRRRFVQLLALLSTGGPLAHAGSAKTTLGQTDNEVYKNLKDPWLTLAKVQEHLFPADKTSPGAKDINALRFLRNMLDAPDTDTEERSFVLQGVNWLNDLSVKKHQEVFRLLPTEDKEAVLRTIESSRAGSRWLSLMMTHLIEGLLSDPVYGGNHQGKGWAWLNHKPGFPTPGVDKVYFKLGQATRRRTKA